MQNPKHNASKQPASHGFPTTQWSLVLRVRDSAAFSSLCALYRAPLVTYVRRARGYSQPDAEDVVQDFFACLTQSRALSPEEGPGRGPFRSYLLGALKHHLSRGQRRARAQKRGAGVTPQQLDETVAASDDGAELAYDRAWAVATLEHAIERLEATYLKQGKGGLFFTLKRLLEGEEVDAPVCVSEPMLRVALHRFRRRLGREVRSVVASTVADEPQIEREVQHLTHVLRHTHWSLDGAQRCNDA